MKNPAKVFTAISTREDEDEIIRNREVFAIGDGNDFVVVDDGGVWWSANRHNLVRIKPLIPVSNVTDKNIEINKESDGIFAQIWASIPALEARRIVWDLRADGLWYPDPNWNYTPRTWHELSDHGIYKED